jgi:RNA polymerase sigma-70 factor (ECF subfamily)
MTAHFLLPGDSHGTGGAGASASTVARDRAWVAAIRAGDVAAFEAMYRAYKTPLGGYVQHLLGSREAAEEVIHDLFLRLWEQRELWEPPAALNTYLFRAARNRALSYLRHQRVEAKFRERSAQGMTGDEALSAPPSTPDDALRLQEIEEAVERAVAALPERCREVFRLNRYQRLSYAEVAQVLQISVKTVEMQMGRALAALRRQLAEWRE